MSDSIIGQPRKTALDPVLNKVDILHLQRLALEMRRKLLYMGYKNYITLHYGALFSMTEIMTLLFHHWLDVDPSDPEWEGRDRFVLSKGHGAPALYIALAMLGFFDETHFDGFRRLGSILQGHPDRNKTPGVDCSSGSLGQGFPVACGMALGAKIDQAPYKVYTLMSDGECNEGSIWEAAQIASNLGLDRIRVLLDWNRKSSYGFMKGRNDIEPLLDKWIAFNWQVSECDGHDFVSLSNALSQAETIQNKPVIILCHTTKGKGVPLAEFYKTKPHILLSEQEYRECLEHLDKVEEGLENA
jgi:transketolase